MNKLKISTSNLFTDWQAHMEREIQVWREKVGKDRGYHLYEHLKRQAADFNPSPGQYELMMRMAAEELEI
jgi:hypothetical protein